MHYLASSLKGRALDSIKNIAIIAENFHIAWRALTTRFENKRRIIASHFSSLFGLSGLTRESASDLQGLCDKVNIAVASLRGLNRTPSDLWNDFIVHLLSQKLDPASRKSWNLRTSDADDPPTYEELNHFLLTRIRALEDCNQTIAAKTNKPANSRVHVANASTTAPSACPLCKARHYLSACAKFAEQNPTQRRETVKRLKRCFNCLSAIHSAQDCRSQHSCRTCRKRHHTMLHMDSDSIATSVASQALETSSSPSAEATSEIISLLASTTPRARAQILLATARIRIAVASGRSVLVRALIDQGSEATFISESLAQTLRARRIRMPTTISAVGGAQLNAVKQAAEVTISPRNSASPSLTTTALILSSLTSYAPKREVDLSTLAHLKPLSWADSDPTSSDPIHVLLGADLYSEIILDGVKKGDNGQPFAQNSVFGWIISGPLDSEPSSSSAHVNITVHHCTPLSELTASINRFWELEDLPCSHGMTPQEEQCEAHFRATHSRAADGRYIVRLPFKKGPPIDIGQSRRSAERLMSSLASICCATGFACRV